MTIPLHEMIAQQQLQQHLQQHQLQQQQCHQQYHHNQYQNHQQQQQQQQQYQSQSSFRESLRWSAAVAKGMADMIQQEVRNMLRQSRLQRRPNGLKLVHPQDIVHVGKILGQGAFSQVTSVTTSDGQTYACKHLKEDLMEQPDNFRLAAAEMACEAHMLASFDHPHIMKIRGWAHNGIASFEAGRHDSFFLLLDQLEETLDDRIAKWQREPHICGGLPPSMNGCSDLWRQHAVFEEQQQLMYLQYQSVYIEKLRIMWEIASALSYLHDHGVIFRDLKPNNIGFLNGRVQLFDFGLSREMPTLDTTIPFEMSGKVGTLRYMATEVAMHQPYNVSADVYSWAMVSYELISLQKPFGGWTRDMHTQLVCAHGVRPDLNQVPAALQGIIEQAWSSIPQARPTVPDISSQLQLLEEQQLFQLQKQQQLQVLLQQEKEQQQAAAAAAMYVEFPLVMAPPTKKLARQYSFDTLETQSLSADSLDF